MRTEMIKEKEGIQKAKKQVKEEAKKATEKEGLRTGLHGQVSRLLKPQKEDTVDPMKDPNVQPDPKSEHVPDPKQQKIKGSPFIKGEGDKNDVEMNDVRQGRLGDCYFLASLAALAKTDPELIKSRVKDNGDGTYTVLFFEGGAVVVDNTFPTDESGQPVYASPDDKNAEGVELWVMLIEKAWAKLKGGYEQIRGSKVRMKSEDAMEAVSGRKTKVVYLSDGNKDTIFQTISAALQKGAAVTAGSRGEKELSAEEWGKARKLGVYANHMYAVVSVDVNKGVINLYNPWGAEYKVSPLSADDFVKYYELVNLNMK
jgi:hypothetical protein